MFCEVHNIGSARFVPDFEAEHVNGRQEGGFNSESSSLDNI